MQKRSEPPAELYVIYFYLCVSDALAIDFLNGNYYHLPMHNSRNPPRPLTSSTHTHTGQALPPDRVFQLLTMSCENMDCLECRAYRLGLDYLPAPSGSSPCPSLQMQAFGHGDARSAYYGAFPGDTSSGNNYPSAADAHLDYNYNSQSSSHYNGHYNGFGSPSEDELRGRGFVSGDDADADGGGGLGNTLSSAKPLASYNNNNASSSQCNNSNSSRKRGFEPATSSAQHRRQDFKKTASSRWTTTSTSATDNSYSLASSSNDSSLGPPEYRYVSPTNSQWLI